MRLPCHSTFTHPNSQIIVFHTISSSSPQDASIGTTKKKQGGESLMLLNYQYRAYPTTNQKEELNDWKRICQYWYNWQIGDRFNWWEQNRDYAIFPQGEFCYISCSLPPIELRNNPDYYSQKKGASHLCKYRCK